MALWRKHCDLRQPGAHRNKLTEKGRSWSTTIFCRNCFFTDKHLELELSNKAFTKHNFLFLDFFSVNFASDESLIRLWRHDSMSDRNCHYSQWSILGILRWWEFRPINNFIWCVFLSRWLFDSWFVLEKS